MMKKVTIQIVRNRIQEQISANYDDNRDSRYAVLAQEGYNGGYLNALDDVLLFLRGVRPNRNNWWCDQENNN